MKSLKELILEKIKDGEKELNYNPQTIDEVWDNIYYLGIDGNSAEVTKDLIVNFRGDLYLRSLDINKLPFKMGEVSGNFKCANCPITTLEGFPQTVGGNFTIEFLDLDDLVGGPKKVGGNYETIDCTLTSLNGAPRIINESFISYTNRFKDLSGTLKRVKGNFVCHENKGTKFTESDVRDFITVDGKVKVYH